MSKAMFFSFKRAERMDDESLISWLNVNVTREINNNDEVERSQMFGLKIPRAGILSFVQLKEISDFYME